MSVKIVVPPLGESVTEATVAKWHKKAGEAVAMDELLVELETDKVTLEVNSPSSGVIESITNPEGSTVELGDLLGVIAAGAAVATAATKPTPTAAIPQTQAVQSSVASVIASPAADKIAKDLNVNLSVISGTGKDGRVTKADVITMPPMAAAPVVVNNAPREERVRMTRLRKTIAERLKQSQNTAAILTTFNEIDMSEIIRIRKQYQDKFVEKHGIKLGFMSFFVKAAVAALRDIPAVNAEIDGNDIVYKNYYDIGIAVGTEQGLVVPVLRDADQKSFGEVEAEIVGLSKKAKDGKLTMADLSGATFSITNGGTYGSLLSTPIINPPQSGILGMHNIVERPVAINGQVIIRPMMYVALSYDHRIIDGREAVIFLVKLKNLCENPEKLLFDL